MPTGKEQAPDAGSSGPPEQDLRLRNRNRLLLIGLMVLALLPLIAAVTLYYGGSGLIAGAQTNRGWLLDPPGDLESLGLVDREGAVLVPGERRRWRLLVVTGGDCDEDCMQALELLRQVHILLGRDADRLQRLAVLAPDAPTALRARLQERLPELELLRGPADLLQQALDGSNLRGQQPVPVADELRQGLLTVDPLGNVILYHGLDQIGSDVLSDLKQLLRLSNIG